jgi:hypothetical protein
MWFDPERENHEIKNMSNPLMKKITSILFALALVSCCPSVNQSATESSASNSIET